MTRFDLHLHSALSACAEDCLSPRRLVERASRAGLSLLALTDHNASGNVPPAIEAGRQVGVEVVPGLELTTREEVHVLVLFDALEPLVDWQAVVDAALPALENRPAVFGHQVLYDAADEIIGVDDRLRQVGVSLGLEAITEAVHARGGAVIPAHVLRPRHSLVSQLGFIDPSASYDALELGRRDWQERGCRLGERLEGFPVLTGSDAHCLEDVGATWLEIDAAVHTIGGLLAAVRRMAA